MSRRSVCENMGTGFPVQSWILLEPEVHNDQLKYQKSMIEIP